MKERYGYVGLALYVTIIIACIYFFIRTLKHEKPINDEVEENPEILNLKFKYLDLSCIVSKVVSKIFLSLDDEIIDFLGLSTEGNPNYLVLYDKYLKMLSEYKEESDLYIKATCLLISLVECPQIYSPDFATNQMTGTEFEQYISINFEVAIRCACSLADIPQENLIKNSKIMDMLYRSTWSIINSNNDEKTSSIRFYSQMLRNVRAFI